MKNRRGAKHLLYLSPFPPRPPLLSSSALTRCSLHTPPGMLVSYSTIAYIVWSSDIHDLSSKVKWAIFLNFFLCMTKIAVKVVLVTDNTLHVYVLLTCLWTKMWDAFIYKHVHYVQIKSPTWFTKQNILCHWLSSGAYICHQISQLQ